MCNDSCFPGLNQASSILESLLSGDYGQQVEPVDAVAHIYVWLRFSANRLITWQRNYNTQPRILSAAQARSVCHVLSHTAIKNLDPSSLFVSC